MKELIERLKRKLEYEEKYNNKYPDSRSFAFEHRILLSVNETKLIIAKLETIDKLQFMIDNGLGPEDMINDITYPHEL
jgi:hypothetical protein